MPAPLASAERRTDGEVAYLYLAETTSRNRPTDA